MNFDDFRIIIDAIPHRDQRYDTVGDYVQHEDALVINVSKLADHREMLLVAIHELIEWALCQAAGISNAEVDKFDMGFGERYRYPGPIPIELGDDSNAPYYKQHQIATGIERILAAEMGVDWIGYETHIQELER